MKTNKSITKRLKVTKNGKVLARKPGQGHFNAKARRRKQLSKKGLVEVGIKKKILKRLLTGKL